MNPARLDKIWEEHTAHEFTTRDTEATLATMVEDAYVNHVPVMTGGRGIRELREFYSRDFIPSMPPDTTLTPISRTVGEDQLVDEMIFSFTHSQQMPWMLPGVPPTNRRVEVPLVVVVRFQDGKLAHEHIYWDQASVLKQIGLITDPNLPVFGVETARKVRGIPDYLNQSETSLADPVAAFIEVACVPRDTGHGSGTLEHAETILARYPYVARSNIYTAAILADEVGVRGFLSRDAQSSTTKGGPHGWDALTYLCFSRYMRLDATRSQAFVRTARALLDAGASANTGWFEMIDHPNPRPVWESAIYGAAGVAHHPELTRLLLEYGADPNDEETPYHVPEGYDNTVVRILLDSGKLNETSRTWMLLRKTDWHDCEGVRLLLEGGADPNTTTRFGGNAFHHAVGCDNHLKIIEALLDYGADPNLRNIRDGKSGAEMAAHRGRGDVLSLLEQRHRALELNGVDRLIAACAKGDREGVQSLSTHDPNLVPELIAQGGTLLSEFAGNGNVEGVRQLLDLGVSVNSPYKEGDRYFDIAQDSTALHVAAWRAWPGTVKELIHRGASVNAADGKGRTPLMLAVKACVDSYWKNRRSPESVAALLEAGATVSGIEIPSGYDEVDALLRQYS